MFISPVNEQVLSCWEFFLDLSTYLLEATLSLLQQDVKCKKCARALQDRVACVVKDWAAVKVKQLEHASRVWY